MVVEVIKKCKNEMIGEGGKGAGHAKDEETVNLRVRLMGFGSHL
jgi:hypothetical protein